MENGNQGAFACPESGTENFTTWQGQVGLTKREYFAGLAMQGMASSDLTYEDIAHDAVKMADALLVELDKPKNEAE